MKIPKKYYLRIFMIIIAVISLFHISQVSLRKSVYNKWDSTGDYNHIEAAILDISVYVNGNIANTDEYLQLSKYVGHNYIFNNTLYPFYTLLDNFGIINEPAVINDFFIKTGNFSTNTINAIAYYIDDAGVIYSFFMVLIIFVYMEKISRRNSNYSKIIYPFILFVAIMFFRQNDFLMIYFYITNILVYLCSIKIKL